MLQLLVPGRDRRSGPRLPQGVRAALAVEAVVSTGIGLPLFAAAGDGPGWWPWALTDLTSKAIGTWLIGIGIMAGVVAAMDDRRVLGGWSVAQVVLGAVALLGLARFAGDLDGGVATVVVGWYALTVVMGACSSLVAHRAGAFVPQDVARALPVTMTPVPLPDHVLEGVEELA